MQAYPETPAAAGGASFGSTMTRPRPSAKVPRLAVRVPSTGVPSHLGDELASHSKIGDDQDRIVLNVGGTRFETTVGVLKRFPENSLISKFLFEEKNSQMRIPDEDGSYFIDWSHETFAVLLSASRRNVAPRMPPNMESKEWFDDLRYWGISTDELDNEDALIAQSNNTDKYIRDLSLSRARTLFRFLRSYAKVGAITEVLLPRRLATPEFEKNYSEGLPSDHAPVNSFEWHEDICHKDVRRYLWEMGLKIKTNGKSRRFMSKRAKSHELLWRMLGEVMPPQVTMHVLRCEVSFKKPEEEFDENLDQELFGSSSRAARNKRARKDAVDDAPASDSDDAPVQYPDDRT